MIPTVLIAAGSAWVIGTWIGFVLGVRTGRRAIDRRLAGDSVYRQQVLERLAELHGAKLEIRE